jgi:hypothetical protein
MAEGCSAGQPKPSLADVVKGLAQDPVFGELVKSVSERESSSYEMLMRIAKSSNPRDVAQYCADHPEFLVPHGHFQQIGWILIMLAHRTERVITMPDLLQDFSDVCPNGIQAFFADDLLEFLVDPSLAVQAWSWINGMTPEWKSTRKTQIVGAFHQLQNSLPQALLQDTLKFVPRWPQHYQIASSAVLELLDRPFDSWFYLSKKLEKEGFDISNHENTNWQRFDEDTLKNGQLDGVLTQMKELNLEALKVVFRCSIVVLQALVKIRIPVAVPNSGASV